MNSVLEKEEIKTRLQLEYENIINRKWYFLNNLYNLEKRGYHRTELKEINHIDIIKKEIENKIGVLATFVFITDFCSKFKLPGPYRDVDKALIVLYHMICGISINQMVLYLKVPNYFKIYKYIFITKYNELDKWINSLMYSCFSNITTRLLTSQINNPDLVKHVTLLLDGHHNKIIYENIDIDRDEMYSWKLKKPGLNTQFIIDLNRIAIYVSESLPCRDNNDDLMFINNIEFHHFFSLYDNICFDGLYENTLLETIQKYNQNNNINMELSNFTFPIKKQKGIELDDNENKYNKYCGGFRSTIETYFADLGCCFKRFSGQNNIRVTKLKTYNIQLRLACLLLNIKRFSELSNLVIPEKCYQWTYKSFDYPDKGIIPKTEKIIYRFNLAENIKNKQFDLLNAIMYNIKNLEINNEDNIMESSNILDKEILNNENVKEKLYEVQYIITHKINELTNEKEYFVKWKKYNKKYNSWVKEKDFLQKQILNNYNSSIMEE
jgi:hypothetical protein